MKINLSENVFYILNRYKLAGIQAYAVGGCVRDSVLGKTPHDTDICVSCSPDETKRIFYGFKIADTGLNYGTVTLYYNGDSYEITSFRSESGYYDGRHPNTLDFSATLRDDLERRDFTVNAMAASADGNITDLFGGVEDIKNGLIRAVGRPEKRFSEDSLRILRAVRFAATLGFSIEEKTMTAVLSLAPTLERVSGERLAAELIKTIPAAKGRFEEFLPVFRACCPEALLGNDAIRACNVSGNSETAVFSAFFTGTDPENARSAMRRFGLSKRTESSVLFLLSSVSKSLDEFGFADIAVDYGLDAAKELYDYRESLSMLSPSEKDAARHFFSITPCVCLSDLAVDGNDLIALGLSGADVGNMLRFLLTAVEREQVDNKREPLIALSRSKIGQRLS